METGSSEQVKRKRGRPRKYPIGSSSSKKKNGSSDPTAPKRKRGRPRKRPRREEAEDSEPSTNGKLDSKRADDDAVNGSEDIVDGSEMSEEEGGGTEKDNSQALGEKDELKRQIKLVEADIKKVEEAIEAVEGLLDDATANVRKHPKDKFWRDEVQRLGKREDRLRDKENNLRAKENKLIELLYQIPRESDSLKKPWKPSSAKSKAKSKADKDGNSEEPSSKRRKKTEAEDTDAGEGETSSDSDDVKKKRSSKLSGKKAKKIIEEIEDEKDEDAETEPDSDDFKEDASEDEEDEEEENEDDDKELEDFEDEESFSEEEVIPRKRLTRSKSKKSKGTSKKDKKVDHDDNEEAEDADDSENDFDVPAKIECTVCFKAYNKSYIYQHPLLKVATCRKCVKDYINTEWPKDEDGYDEYCRWSMKSSEALWVCEKCTRVFDSEIIKQNLGEELYNKINSSDDWNCLVCDPSQLKDMKQDWPIYGQKKKRKARRKSEGGDADKKNSKSKYRRNIKKVLTDDELSAVTKDAMRFEKNRLKVLKDRKTEHEKQAAEYDDKVKELVVLNPYHSSAEDPVYVSEEIGKRLKKHQIEGTRFLWSNIADLKSKRNTKPKKGKVADGKSSKKNGGKAQDAGEDNSGKQDAESGSKEKEEETASKKEESGDEGGKVKVVSTGTGCILAHLMGLGKTLQTITIVTAFLDSGEGGHAMIIAPVNVLTNWSHEFHKWLEYDSRPKIVNMSEAMKTTKARMKNLKKWKRQGGVLIIGFEMIRNLCVGKRLSTREREKFQSLLLEEADLVVVDEGHRIKNSKSGLAKVLSQLGTRRRIVLTGTPLQNNLMEYFFMIDFVRPNFMGTPKDFRNRFETPIMNGQCVDSNEDDVKLMRERAFVLHNKVQGFVHRRGYRDIAHELPQKHVYTLFISLSPLQKRLYARYLRKIQRKSLFQDYHMLNKIWNHPSVVHHAYKEFMTVLTKKRERAMEEMFIDDAALSDADTDDLSFTEDEERMKAKTEAREKSQAAKKERREAEMREKKEKIKAMMNPTHKNGMAHDWFREIFPPPNADLSDDEELLDITLGPKFQVTIELTKRIIAQGEKVVIFSQNLTVLDLLEKSLQQHLDYDLQKNYFRLDGSVCSQERQNDIDKFNMPGSKQNVFLLSTKAGSLGINLVGANHAIIFDSSWNPSHDLQAVFRIYRFGQKKDVFVYRLVSHQTMEQKIYERQLTKRGLALRVVDEKQVQRCFMQSDLQELYFCDFREEVQAEKEPKAEAMKVEKEEGDTDTVKKEGPVKSEKENGEKGMNGANEDKDEKTDMKEAYDAVAEAFKDHGIAAKVEDLNKTKEGSKVLSDLMRTSKSSVYNPYEKCRKDLAQSSLMWWVLARFGSKEQKGDALKALKKYQDLVKMEKSLNFASPKPPKTKSKVSKKKSKPRKKKRNGVGDDDADDDDDDDDDDDKDEDEDEDDDQDEENEKAQQRKSDKVLDAKMSLVRSAKEVKGKLRPQHLINGFHEPTMLLEHIDTEALNDDERKKALENFEKSLQKEANPYGQAQYNATTAQAQIAQAPPENWPMNERVPYIVGWQQRQIWEFLDAISMPMLKQVWYNKILVGGQLFFLIRDSPELSVLPMVMRNKFLKALMQFVMDGNAACKRVWTIHETQDGQSKIFFHNKVTSASQWDPPLELRYDFGQGQREFYRMEEMRRQELRRQEEQQRRRQMMQHQQHQGGFKEINPDHMFDQSRQPYHPGHYQ